jgi:hypothetical protein
MASRKAKTVGKKVATRTANKAVQLPEGYEVIERAPTWDHEANPIINGKRGPIDEMTFGRGTKNEYDAEVMVVSDKNIGDVAVWRSGGLAQLFDDTREGDEVFIQFIGYGEPKEADQQPAKLFKCAVKRTAKGSRNPF